MLWALCSLGDAELRSQACAFPAGTQGTGCRGAGLHLVPGPDHCSLTRLTPHRHGVLGGWGSGPRAPAFRHHLPAAELHLAASASPSSGPSSARAWPGSTELLSGVTWVPVPRHVLGPG